MQEQLNQLIPAAILCIAALYLLFVFGCIIEQLLMKLNPHKTTKKIYKHLQNSVTWGGPHHPTLVKQYDAPIGCTNITQAYEAFKKGRSRVAFINDSFEIIGIYNSLKEFGDAYLEYKGLPIEMTSACNFIGGIWVMSINEISQIKSPVHGMMIYNKDIKSYQWYDEGRELWINIGN